MGHVTPEDLLRFLLFFPILVISVAIHEFAHCWSSDRLGDDTARRLGRVTLNPLKHLDPLGTLMMVFSSFAGMGFGWGKASPFDPNNFRNPARDRMLTALAGPMSNILQMFAWASILTLVLHFVGREHGTLFMLCIYGIIINAALAVFNLLPVFPLDGHHIISYFAPPSWRPIIDNPNWMYVFLALVLFPPLRMGVLWPVINPVREKLVELAFLLVGLQLR